ncbi:hypothetical protein D3C78_17630 [compost metagenome]
MSIHLKDFVENILDIKTYSLTKVRSGTRGSNRYLVHFGSVYVFITDVPGTYDFQLWSWSLENPGMLPGDLEEKLDKRPVFLLGEHIFNPRISQENGLLYLPTLCSNDVVSVHHILEHDNHMLKILFDRVYVGSDAQIRGQPLDKTSMLCSIYSKETPEQRNKVEVISSTKYKQSCWMDHINTTLDFAHNPNNKPIWHLLAPEMAPLFEGKNILIDAEENIYLQDGTLITPEEAGEEYRLWKNLKGD